MTMEGKLHNRRREVPHDVASWRRNVLLRAGFSATLADELAGDARIDLHDVLKLVDRGCPPDLAARILAPL
jgi:hypothetical protein